MIFLEVVTAIGPMEESEWGFQGVLMRLLGDILNLGFVFIRVKNLHTLALPFILKINNNFIPE